MHFTFFVWLLSILVLGESAVLQTKKNLLAGKTFCGYQHSDDFIRKVNTTAITEFPWLARLAFTDATHPTPVLYTCLGSLISDRYVITSALCAEDEVLTLEQVRLGEFNFYNPEDCVDEVGIEECSEPVQDYQVEKIIIHPNYTGFFENNIALIRLQETVRYSDYIRPVCLPSPDTDDIKSGDILTTSGWHNLVQKGDIKMSVSSQLISFQECGSKYREKFGIKLNENIICTARLNGSIDMTCVGDYGAPVAVPRRRQQWYQEGVVAYSLERCVSDFPVVLTKVSSYYNWIVDSLEP